VGFSESHCDYSRYMEERDLMLEQIRQNGATNQDNAATVVEENERRRRSKLGSASGSR